MVVSPYIYNINIGVSTNRTISISGWFCNIDYKIRDPKMGSFRSGRLSLEPEGGLHLPGLYRMHHIDAL